MNADAKLIDGWQRNREHPGTFLVPSLQDLMKLRPGMHVKLGVEFPADKPPRGERFWVEVVDNETGPPINGIVRQSDMLLTRLHGVADGDEIFFEPCHVLAIYDGD